MKRKNPGVEDIWKRQIGETCPRTFSQRMGGSEDLIKRLQLSVKLEKHRGCVNTVHFNSAGDILVSGSDDREIIIWDWAAKVKKLTFHSGHTNNVFQARIMPYSEDKHIVSCAADGQVRFCEIQEGGRVNTRRIGRHRGRAHKLAIEPGSSNIFFSCGEDGVVQRFDIRDKRPTKLLTCQAFVTNKATKPPIVHLNAIVIDPRNPSYFTVGGSDEFARVYDIRMYDWGGSSNVIKPVNSFSPYHLIGNDSVHITGLAYSNQSELLVSYNDELIYLFEKDMDLGPNPSSSAKMPENSEKPQVFEGHRNAKTVKGVSFFGLNTEYVVSGSDCGHIYIWKKKTGQLVHMMHGDKCVVNCLEPHPYATILATSGIEKNIKIWEPVAEHLLPFPDQAEKLMRANKRKREQPAQISPLMIMQMLGLHGNLSDDDEDSGSSWADIDDEDEYNDYIAYSMDLSSNDDDNNGEDENDDDNDGDNDDNDDNSSNAASQETDEDHYSS